MFTIIGGDGKEYGPATAAQVRSWIAAGRANLQTKAKPMGSDEWSTLGDFPEFSSFGVEPPLVGPPVNDPTLAERWRRLLGAIVDGALESLCWTPSSLAMMRALSEMTSDHSFNPNALLSAFWGGFWHSLPYLAALFAVQVTLLSLRSQSIGNLLTGTRIVRVTDGAPGGFLRAFLLRGFLARVIRQIPLFGAMFWIVDSLFIFRPDKRCVHDLIAGTKVIKV